MAVGIKVGINGENEYRKALKEITSNLKLMSSEMKLTSTEFERGDKNLKQTKASYDSMNKSVKEQKESISALRTKLEEAEKTYGKNNTVVQELKTKLNQAETQMKQMEDATDKTTQELIDMRKGFNDAGEGAVKFGDLLKANILGDAIVGGVKALGSAIKSIGSAFVDMGKQAVSGYADFEQLYGGIETLFGTGNLPSLEDYAKSIGKGVDQVENEYWKLYDKLVDVEQDVLSKANNAYKTAGLSTNQYLETVTSFSASLIAGLKGDTAKAAEIADMAIIDMADNANKMGSDISSIQTAYQGFAKQQYTLLDNLKLGYGGTKTEMERLLSDAQKISGVKYDISNLKDVYEAIHIIQTEMGITGTTAKEASETISGSIGSMKSAWQNLIAGLANGEDDNKMLVQNLVESVKTVAKNLIPVVKETISGLVETIGELLNEAFDTDKFSIDGDAFVKDLVDGLKSVIKVLGWILENKDAIITGIVAMGTAIGVLNVANMIMGVVKAFKAWKLANEGVTIAQWAMNTAMSANPIGLIVALIAGLVAGIIALWKTNDDFREAVINAWNKIKEVFSNVWGGITNYCIKNIW